MDGVRYRSYVVRVWHADPSEPAETRVRVEWIAPGIEVELRGDRATSLADRLDQAFDPDFVARDGTDVGRVDANARGRH